MSLSNAPPRGALMLVAGALACLTGPPIAHARARARAPGAPPPMVMVVFDEFSMTDLLGTHERVDPVAYPAFARLAAGALTFRNYTAPGDETNPATAMLLTSGPFRRLVKPYARNYRHTLFTFLAPRYRLVSDEEVTAFCPHRLCSSSNDHIDRADVRRFFRSGRRRARWYAWLRRIRPTTRPTLFYKHAMFPHMPFEYLPDGRDYRLLGREPPRLFSGGGSFGDPWLVREAWQRHLLQVRFTDRLLGALLARLRAARLYDRALIVVTADNGEAFGHVGHDRHVIDPVTAPEIASTPLFIKLPGQTRGDYRDEHVRAADVLPTIAGVLRRRLPWHAVGRDALRHPRAIPSRVLLHQRHAAPVRWTLGQFARLRRAAVARRVAVFGQDGRSPALWSPGPARGVVGRRLSRPAARSRALRAQLNGTLWDRAAFRDVAPRSPSVPAFVAGALTGPLARRGLAIAVSVNGRVAATGESSAPFVDGRRRLLFSVLVPPTAFRAGRNVVRALLVERRGARRRLVAIPGAS